MALTIRESVLHDLLSALRRRRCRNSRYKVRRIRPSLERPAAVLSTSQPNPEPKTFLERHFGIIAIRKRTQKLGTRAPPRAPRTTSAAISFRLRSADR